MLRLLLAKDLRRVWRNPTPWLVHLAMPLLITALIGLAFGRGASGSGFGRIRLAIVDEDDSLLTRLLQGALSQRDAGEYLEPVVLKRPEAMRQIGENELSAVIVIPAGFTRDYVSGERQVTLELIKNPAQAFHPAIVEEILAAGVTVLNAVARPLQGEFPAWRATLEREGGPDPRAIGDLIERAGDRFGAARDYLFPPLVGYEQETLAAPAKERRPAWSVFAVLLPGLAAMFLLFLADNAIRDLYREERFRTFERFRTAREGLFVFVISKVALALTILFLSSVIMLGGGAWLFRIRWEHPGLLALLVGAYAFFAAGFMALLAALAGKERRADLFNTVTGMALGLMGGCMFPPEQLPGFLRHYITPYLPTRWFVAAAQSLQFGGDGWSWPWVCLALGGAGVGLMALAAALFRCRFERGIRP
jgi:ABC-2 type transport system permease protein